MQVGAGGEPGLADIADDLALLDLAALAQTLGEARHVAIGRAVGAAVF